ncbi:MAG: hypothetical protein LCI00_24285 [Chloroflexi bacterium]|nr:hypothetical protein [Chloroflexota bacterium]
MNGIVEFIFAEMWEYTKLTFRIIFWVFRQTLSITSFFRNRNQNIPKVAKSDLFDKDGN